jgi:DNA uptake protein ComE-like DNA-binding protein
MLRRLLFALWAVAAVACEPEPRSQPSAAPSILVDINHATEAELRALPRIDVVYARKIIAGRPYANKTQLLSRDVLPRGTYEAIVDKVIAHTSP